MHRNPLTTLLLALTLIATPVLAEEEAAAPTAQYVELKPAFVGTLGAGPRIQYLKADVALRTDDPAAVERIHYHDALIRNALVFLFSEQLPENLSTLEGKEALRASALAAVQKVLEEEEGDPLVDDLLFTNLIVQ
ncbi:flagellar basal body-associated protein FliL [Halopseudomonas oceani]|jgi:flagellar FliL protein|uniref:Flagellar protein FliL n=1 Tax=Halopseudomonas oceani TaxID=1708783 RepID=A0A2P4EZR7_9GAMM|nr:flagellar basal body-associated FliL family protein [Halopseudomonas oceani]POB06244.1 flagellar basal body-associated protein FliL [Halopseudomonas oceani]GGE37028.1 flagellar basal body-associated protein FliL [Halopseudomonas oceani]